MTQFEIKDGVAIIPEGMTEIPFRAFINCEDLTIVFIPDSVTCIVNGAFYGCSSLTEIVIPNSVTSIGAGAFSRCYSLKNIVVPNGVTSIGDRAFCCAPRRKLVIRNVRKLVTENEPTTVKNASSLTSVTLPESLTELGKDVFLGCEKLETIYVPAKKANFYREHLPETLHDKIVEFEPEQK